MADKELRSVRFPGLDDRYVVPEGGGSGGGATDLSLGITGAQIGQIAKITAVDTDGKPTAWEAVDAGSTPTMYGVTLSLTNCAASNAATSVQAGASYSAVLTADAGYTIGMPTVTMGGTDITSTAWDASMGTVSITVVTGNIIIICVAEKTAQPSTETLTTMKWKQSGWPTFTERDDGGADLVINETLYADPAQTNPYWTLLYPGQISGGKVQIKFNKAVTSGGITVCIYAVNANANIAYNSLKNGAWTTAAQSGTTSISADFESPELPAGTYPFVWIRNGSLLMEGDTDPSTINTAAHIKNGDIVVTVSSVATAENTETLSVDADYLQDYGQQPAIVTQSASALSEAYRTVIEQAKNAWMIECNGSVDKIPLIIHTDQHGRMLTSELFDAIDGMVDWYEISKVINLGDTVGAWVDSSDTPLLTDAELAQYLEAMASVPYSKRIEVFGNHDTWKLVDGNYIGLTPQNYLRKYFKNIYARGRDDYGNFVVHDDRYNVKYLCISSMAYDSTIGGPSHYVFPSASWEWIIAELEKADEYDVIILSHVPLGTGGATVTDPTGAAAAAVGNGLDWVDRSAVWTARKNKTSGSFADQYGVTHSYDFTGCNGELLCGLHGHIHADGYYHIGGALLDAFFDAYYMSPKAFFFVIVDRKNERLNVWKVDDTPQMQNYRIPFSPTEAQNG